VVLKEVARAAVARVLLTGVVCLACWQMWLTARLLEYSAIRPIIYCTSEIGGKTDLLSVSVDSAEVDRIATFADARSLLHPPQHDEVFYFSKLGGNNLANPNVRWNRITQKETFVTDAAGLEDYVWTLSFDGRWVLRQRNGKLSFRPVSGGVWKTVASGIENFYVLGSTPDGDWTLYLTSDLQRQPGIYEVPFAGGAPRRVGDLPTRTWFAYDGYFVFSPDGRKILALEMTPPQTSLWVLQNFEPKSPK